MKSQKGITLTALVIYIAVATLVIGMIAVISSFFFSNMQEVKKQDKYGVEFNKFNMFFINDIKNNRTAQIDVDTIILEDGTKYYYDETVEAIYRNDTEIAKNITALDFSEGTYKAPNTETTKNLIYVHMVIGEEEIFEKTIEYVLKYW